MVSASWGHGKFLIIIMRNKGGIDNNNNYQFVRGSNPLPCAIAKGINVKIVFINDEFIVDTWMTFEELANSLPLMATAAAYDLKPRHSYMKYEVVDNNLYAFLEDVGLNGEWYNFDPSKRKWVKCFCPHNT